MGLLGTLLGTPERVGAVASHPEYTLDVRLQEAAPHLSGTVTIQLHNSTTRPLTEVTLVSFANRFADPASDSGVNDVTRPFVYPELDFDPGSTRIVSASAQGQSLTWQARDGATTSTEVAVVLPLPEPLPPGGETHLQIEFATTLPYRFGPLGRFEDMLTATGGWYPRLARLRTDGSWAVDEGPGIADVRVQIARDAPLDLLVNGNWFPAAGGGATVDLAGVHYVSLVAGQNLVHETIAADATTVTLVTRRDGLRHRLSFGRSIRVLRRAAIRDIVRTRFLAGFPFEAQSPAIVIVEVPLRQKLAVAAEGMVLLSDRALRVSGILRGLHVVRMAREIYAELLRHRLAARESAVDFPWVSEGLGHAFAERYRTVARPRGANLRAWTDWFDLFAIVDRFEAAPKVPFLDTILEHQSQSDELQELVWSIDRRELPGREIFSKLEQKLGAPTYAEIIEDCAFSQQPFRDCAERVAGQSLGEFFAQWTAAAPEINYRLDDVELNRARQNGWVSELTLVRDSAPRIEEPVDVRLETVVGVPIDRRWEGDAESARLRVETNSKVYQVIVDPDRKLLEKTRADNSWPFDPQIALDSADVEMTSTEFAFSGLAVARRRHDYRRDLAVGGVITNRGVGLTAGGQLHWGTAIDPSAYPHNLYTFYKVQALAADFADHLGGRRPTDGTVAGFGFRYEYRNFLTDDHPTTSWRTRAFADVHDHTLGSDFDFATWGLRLSGTVPVGSYRTIVAGEIVHGFSVPFASSSVPNQSLYSLGGTNSIRGIGAEEELAENLLVLRAEVRQALFPEVDLSLEDIVVLRRFQARAFVDSGRVDDTAGHLYDPREFAVGAGVGLVLVYEFLGFYPANFYVEVATRIDDPGPGDGVQFLFGTRQAF